MPAGEVEVKMDDRQVLGRAHSGFLGSLREALAAAGREEQPQSSGDSSPSAPASLSMLGEIIPPEPKEKAPLNAAEAAREARAGSPHVPPLVRAPIEIPEEDRAPTTRVIRGAAARVVPAPAEPAREVRTQLVRGKPAVVRGTFEQDPVVGWLVVTGGPGLGAFRAIYEGNNTVGRASNQRVALDFGDDTISAEEQAYIRYDSSERGFLFVPNLAKTNIVAVNGKRPTAAVPMAAMDVIQMGRTQLVFVPFCGAEFDWAELTDKQA